MGIFALSTLLVAGAGIYIFSKVFPNFQPGNKKVQADLKDMREELAPAATNLVPLDNKDLELLAAEEEEHKVKKGFTTKVKGTLSTIFHEPVALYSYKKYLSTSGKDAVLYVKTARHEYFYWIKHKGTKVVIDNSLIGNLENQEILYGGKKDRMIARINRDEEEFMPVLVQGKEIGSIVKTGPGEKQALSTRAFGYVVDNVLPEERAVFLSLAFYELIMRKVEE